MVLSLGEKCTMHNAQLTIRLKKQKTKNIIYKNNKTSEAVVLLLATKNLYKIC